MLGMLHAAGLIVAVVAAQLGQPPVVTGGAEGGRVVASDSSGALRWTSRWTIAETLVEGERVIAMSEDGEGRYSGFEGDIRWSTETLWSAGAPFRPLSSEKVFTDEGGRLLVRQHTEFDYAGATIRFRSEDLRSGGATTERLDLPADTLSIEGIAAALRMMAFEEEPSVDAHIFSPEPRLYDVTFETRGRETLRTAGGEVESYKIEVVPHIGILGLFRFLFPHAYFWFEVDAPHDWVRYEGPENGRGTPTIVMERVD
jgi:hypothetical protein